MERRLTGMIAAAAVLIVLFIVWDAFRPTPRRANAPSEADAPLRIVEPPPAAAQVPQQPTAPPSTTSQGTAVPAGPAGGGGREPSYIELLARSETRRRIRSSGSSTYLGEMLEARGDSMLRRGGERPARRGPRPPTSQRPPRQRPRRGPRSLPVRRGGGAASPPTSSCWRARRRGVAFGRVARAPIWARCSRRVETPCCGAGRIARP